MAENMFPSDGSSQSGGVFSSVTQIPSMEHTGKEPIQAQSQPDSSVQSTARKEPIQAQSQSHSLVQSTGRLKRYKAPACANVIRVGGEIASCKKATSEVEEEEEEIPVRNVKAPTVRVKDTKGKKIQNFELKNLKQQQQDGNLSGCSKPLLDIARISVGPHVAASATEAAITIRCD